MTRAGRALLGASLGAALTLFIHPASRPYLLSLFISPTHHTAPPQRNIPDRLTELSDWMTAMGERFGSRQKLTHVELDNAILAAKKGLRLNPDNPFWHQMLACFYHQLSQEAEAKKEWLTAAACARWDDFQTVELLEERQRLATDFKADQSWQLAYVYFLRSDSSAAMIRSYSNHINNTTSLSDTDGLIMRAANVINGALLRERSQSVRIGAFGADMSETACQPTGINPNLRSHKLYVQRITMQDTLRKLGQPDVADQVYKAYRESDAWDAFVSPEDAADEAYRLAFLSILYVSLPSMLTVIGVIGILVWLVSYALHKLERIDLIVASIMGIALGVGAYLITFLPLAAFVTFLCCIFLTLGPKRERRLKIDELGPMFAFAAGTLGLVFILLFGAFAIGTSAPAVSILPHLGVPHEYFGGSGVLLGLSIIVLALLLLLAPLFAIALRVGTAFVLSHALRKFGAFLAYTSLGFIVIGTPLCIYLDRDNAEVLNKVVTNEPVYYLNLHR